MEQGNPIDSNEQQDVLDAQQPQEPLSPEAPRPTFLLLGSGVTLIGLIAGSFFVTHMNEPQQAPVALEVSAPEPRTDVFDELTLNAQAVYVYDLANERELFEHNAQAQLPLASLTKVMTAIVAAESLSYDSIVSVDAEALRLEGDSGLLVDERWRARDLLDFMLLVSSNDSAHVLAQAAGAAVVTSDVSSPQTDAYSAFIDRMNRKAQEIGLTQTYFLNETGLDTSEAVSGGYGSAKDMANMFAYALTHTPEALDATSYQNLELTSLSNITHDLENTNEIANRIPGLIASKTGYTTLAGGNLIIAFDAGINRPIIISVLGSTREGRFSDVEQLVAATLQVLQETGN